MARWIRSSKLAPDGKCCELSGHNPLSGQISAVAGKNRPATQSIDNAPNLVIWARFAVGCMIPVGNSPRYSPLSRLTLHRL